MTISNPGPPCSFFNVPFTERRVKVCIAQSIQRIAGPNQFCVRLVGVRQLLFRRWSPETVHFWPVVVEHSSQEEEEEEESCAVKAVFLCYETRPPCCFGKMLVFGTTTPYETKDHSSHGIASPRKFFVNTRESGQRMPCMISSFP